MEQTIDKILKQTGSRIDDALDESLQEAQERLDKSTVSMEAEYDRIISDGRKEAEKLERQIVGSADLEGRNRQLVAVEDAVDRVFARAVSQVSKMPRDDTYSSLCERLFDEAAAALNIPDMVVYTNGSDRNVVLETLDKRTGAVLSDQEISCLGGVRVTSPDGSISFDNTLDARVERLKPLIRKEIAAKFGVEQ